MIGKIINGKYKVTEKLGTGGYGEVYKAYHVQLNTPWALKIIPRWKDYGQNELEVLKSVNHPVFPRLVDIIYHENESILIFDYYEGRTLLQVIIEHGVIEETMVCDIGVKILDALLYLHNYSPGPIIYRDLKPSNLMLLADGSIKMIDFGSARHFKQKQSDDTVYLGTPGYAAPEQYGLGQTDERTDIYNFGMTIFHMITGKHPLECQDISLTQVLNEANISNKLTEIILKCTEKDPNKRYSNINEIINAFKNINLSNKQNPVQMPKVIGKNAVEVSISGIQKGAGATHFSILFGIWLKEQGYKTAVLECNESKDMMCLCRLVGMENQVKSSGCFKIHGLYIFPSMTKDSIDNFKRSEYDYILIDYGVHDEYISAMTRRSDVKLIIAPGSDWKLGQLERFINKYTGVLQTENTYLSFPMQNQKSIRIIQSHFGFSNMLTIPYAVNPWKMENKVKHELSLIYSGLFQNNHRVICTGKRRG
jgi:serine/threonine protein kinase